MARALTFVRTLAAVGVVALVATLGVTLHAASALLAITPSNEVAADTQRETSALRLAEPGPHAVGMRRMPGNGIGPALTVWYPAQPPTTPTSERQRTAGVHYAYGLAALTPATTVALATYRGRAVPGAAADRATGPYPVVVLSPGFAMGAASYGWLAEHLASHGFLVAGVQHQEALDPQGLAAATVDRPRDVADALDRVVEAATPNAELAGLADVEHAAVLGHSYGGFTALAAGGARLHSAELREACASDGGPNGVLALQCDALMPYLDELAERSGLPAVPTGLWPTQADSRVDAAVALAGDAVMFGASGLASVDVPLLAIGGTADADAPFEWGTQPAYDHSTSARKAEVSLDGAGHLVFAGGCESPRRVLGLIPTSLCSDEAWESAAAHDVVAHYVTAFLRAELSDDAAAREHLAPETQPVIPSVEYRQQGY